MYYSLLNRFRGALLGTVLGETLGASYQKHVMTGMTVSWLNTEQWGFTGEVTDFAPVTSSARNIPNNASVSWSKVALNQTKAVQHSLLSPLPSQALASSAPHSSPTSGLAIAMLPLALVHHENLDGLQSAIQQRGIQWQQAPELAIGAQVVGYTIALALQEQLDPDQLIPRLLLDLDLDRYHPLFADQLNQVQFWKTQGISLANITEAQHSKLKPSNPFASPDSLTETLPIALALYSFISTPKDFRLTLQRVAQVQIQPQMTCAIAGALSGTYNSIMGLPLHWRQAINRSLATSALAGLDISSETEIFDQADQLFAHWAGAYSSDEWLQQPNALIQVKSTKLMR